MSSTTTPLPQAAAAAAPSGTSSVSTSLPPTTSSSSSPSSSDRLQMFLENDPKRTGFDPETSWWMNYFRILSGQVTPEGQHHYREWRYRQNEARDCQRCEDARDYLLRYSPIVRFMAEKTEQLGGHRLDGSNIVCARCPARVSADPGTGELRVVRQGGGFHPNFGILLCANEMRDRKHLEDNLAHEMVHAYDHLRWKVDWDDLRHAACSEIRASMLSGECRWTRESMTRGNWTLTQQFQRCVRMRAIQSLTARPRCRDDVHATKVVNEVWDSCFSDTRPFDDIYK
ncbi:MAG: Mitochondrial inner membrane protease atp23 [Sporothrix epigloea]